MREILFKAKRLDNGEWISGSLVCFAGGARAILPSDSKTLFSKSKGFICCDTCHDVDPSTVCQYTGLTDKNGKKIFDGDVVRRETDYYGKHKVYDEPVVWEDDIEKGFLGEPYTSGYCIHGGNWEVIGSTHDGEGGNHA
jgi:uncharacterized phage protein (TIGR01671 family)